MLQFLLSFLVLTTGSVANIEVDAISTSIYNASRTSVAKQFELKNIEQFFPEAHKTFQEINKYRRNIGIKSLEWDSKLALDAMRRSYELGNRTDWSHEGWEENYLEKNKYKGENLGKYKGVDNKIAEAWFDSEAHHDVMLNTNYSKIGIGEYRSRDENMYITGLFGGN